MRSPRVRFPDNVLSPHLVASPPHLIVPMLRLITPMPHLIMAMLGLIMPMPHLMRPALRFVVPMLPLITDSPPLRVLPSPSRGGGLERRRAGLVNCRIAALLGCRLAPRAIAQRASTWAWRREAPLVASTRSRCVI
jgi:hypothetical protein